MRAKSASKIASIAAATLPFAVVALALSTTALTVTFGSPAPGYWTAASSIDVSGTAGAPNADRRTLDTSAEFAGGTEINVNTTNNRVTLSTDPTEVYRYTQDFTGLAGASALDANWSFNFTNAFWSVSSSALYSATPPALVHAGLGPGSDSAFVWSSILAGAVIDGRVGFAYWCDANAFMNVTVSPSGAAGSESPVLTAGGGVSGTVDFNLSAAVSGSRAIVVRFFSGSTAPSMYCSVDDFQVVATLNVANNAPSPVAFSDDFTAGGSIVWNARGTNWGVASVANSTDSPPALVHPDMTLNSVWVNWGSSSPIINASIVFHYQCAANGSLQAYLSRDGVAETRILNGARGAAHTNFSYNATALLSGSMGTYLRFAADSTSSIGAACGIDDLNVSWNVSGYLALSYAGAYISPNIDAGTVAAFTNADWTAVAPPGTTITVAFRSSTDGSSYSAWSVLASSGTSVAVNARYGQFRVNFTTAGARPLPYLDRLGLNFSGLVRVEVSVNGGPWAPASGTTNWSANVALAGGSNNITARVTDTSGATTLTVLQVWRDTFPPNAPGKPVGPAVTNQTSATWNWAAATDFGLGVDHYTVDIGLTAGGVELGSGLAANGTSFTMSALPDNVRVFATVWAWDVAGMQSLTGATSDATLVDRTAPGAPNVASLASYTADSSITWAWAAAAESGSGVASYIVRVGSSAGSEDIASTTATGLNYTFAAGVSGTAYHFSVAAVDNAGNRGAFTLASSVTVDQAPPSSPAIATSPPTVTNSTALTWSWTASTDALSGVDHYWITLGTAPGGTDIDSTQWASTTYTANSASPGARYYFAVHAFDHAGNEGPAATATGVLVDAEAPTVPVASAVASFVANATLTLTWNASTDQPAANASGVHHYLVRVADGTNVNVSTVTGLEVDVSLSDTVHYTVSIAAVDAAGNEGPAASVSFTSDRTGPAAPTGLKVTFTTATPPTFTASWNGTSDVGSGVREYRISIGTTPGGTDIANGRKASGTSDKWTGQTGKTYYVSVWAVDDLGNVGPSASLPNGVTATPPAPSGGGLLPGPEAGAAVVAALAAALIVRTRRRR